MLPRRVCLGLLLVPTLSLGCGDDTSSGEGGSSGGAADTGSDTDAASADASSSGGPEMLVVSGDAFSFALPGEPYGRIDGATISVLEAPEVSATSDDEGHFVLEGLEPGGKATFVMNREGFPPARTKTFTLPESGDLERVTFQIPDDTLFAALAAILQLEVDESACQIVSTITRVGKSVYDEGAHGVEGTTFEEVAVECAAGVLVNASPPFGLQELE